MKRGFLRIATVLLALFILTGCVARVQQIAFTPPAERIKTIGIPTISPPTLFFQDMKNPALNFGLLGGAAYAFEVKAKSRQIYIEGSQNQFTRQMQTELANGMKKAGYDTVNISLKRDKPGKFINDYAAITGPNVDAVLDVIIVEGGYSNVSWPQKGKVEYGGFRPCLRVAVKLVTPSSGKILYSDTFLYGRQNAFMTATFLEAPADNFMDSFDAMKENREKVRDGLQLAIEQVAQAIAANFTGVK